MNLLGAFGVKQEGKKRSGEGFTVSYESLVAGSELGQAGVARLRQILAGVDAVVPGGQWLKLDVSIARGLDYYTGVVFETFLDDLPTIGSICSGGRYDTLATDGATSRLGRLTGAGEHATRLDPSPIGCE